MVFAEVCSDLEHQGYEITPVVIPAAAVNAPHGRDRVWFVAYSNCGTKGSSRKSRSLKSNGSHNNDESFKWRKPTQFDIGRYEFLRDATNSDSNGFNECNGNNEEQSSKRRQYAQRNFEQIHYEQPIIEHTNVQRQKRRMHQEQPKTTIREQFSEPNARSTKSTNWHNFPTQSPICGGDDGLPDKLDGITFPKWRAESIKGYGNAICPQVTFEIFKAIEKTYFDFQK
jgi:DNA (cytosine-5)-methyltransferase 1